MRLTNVVMIVILFAASSLLASTINVPADCNTIGKALTVCSDGDIIRVSAGTFNETLDINKEISIEGVGGEKTIITNKEQYKGSNTITINANVKLSKLTVKNGKAAIFVGHNARLDISDCIIRDSDDGVLFEADANTSIFMKRCQVIKTHDGVDLESTRGAIVDSKFIENIDDGIDVDDDCKVLISNCQFFDQQDDGIEIRIRKSTEVVVTNCIFERNGEDGIEVIEPQVSGEISNVVCIQNSIFRNNHRFGVGFVGKTKGRKQGLEEPADYKLPVALKVFGNKFEGTYVSDNYREKFDRCLSCPSNVNVNIKAGSNLDSVNVVAKTPVLVGMYNGKSFLDDKIMQDMEAVVVDDKNIYIADDNARTIQVLDKFNSRLIKTISTKPFDGTNVSATGVEGLAIRYIDGKKRLIVSDDEGKVLLNLSLEKENYGQLVSLRVLKELGEIEGVDFYNNKLVCVGNQHIYFTNWEHPALPEICYNISAVNFGKHMAGVGSDEESKRCFATLSGYRRGRLEENQAAAIELAGESILTIKNFWYLEPFMRDPRGITMRDGLLYVADGSYDSYDQHLNGWIPDGVKIYIFAINDTPEAVNDAIKFLPLH